MLTDIKTKEDLDNMINTHGLNYQNEMGEGFLHHFARIGEIELLCHLFDRSRKEKYNINLQNNIGRTALFDAHDEKIIEFLLISKIDYELKDKDGKKAEEINEIVDFIINQKCIEIRKNISKRRF